MASFTNTYKSISNSKHKNDFYPNENLSRELERHIEDLLKYSFRNLNEEHANEIYKIASKILLMREYLTQRNLKADH